MNAERRKKIEAVRNTLQKVMEQIDALQSAELEQIKSEEQQYYENMPLSLESGEKGEKAQSAIDALENAQGTLEGLLSEIDEAISQLEEAAQ